MNIQADSLFHSAAVYFVQIISHSHHLQKFLGKDFVNVSTCFRDNQSYGLLCNPVLIL